MHLSPTSGIMLMSPTRWRKRKLAGGETSMPAQENMTLARRFLEARVRADLDALDEMMTPDYVSHAKLLPDQQPDREGEKWVAAQFAAAFSKRRLLIEDQVAGADKVVTRFIVHFTHDLGEIMGVAPSGREMTNRAIVVHRIVDGKIAEEWGLGTLGSKLRGQSLEQEKLERERVEQELQVARSIQHASLPKEVPTLEGWQISPYYKPAREVEETSTTSTSSLRRGWELWWATLRARGCLQRWLCP